MEFDFRRDTVYGETLIFDGNLNFWEQIADYPGITGASGNAFSLDGKIYFKPNLYLNSGDIRKHFWEYNTIANTWTQLLDYEIELRNNEIMHVVDDKAYMGLGRDANSKLLKDFWHFEPLSSTWNRLPDFPGTNMDISFATNSKIYAGTSGESSSFDSEMWEYDPESNIWTEKTPFPGEYRFNGIAIGIGNKGYFGMGQTEGILSTRFREIWEYDPITDNWSQLTDFPGGARVLPVGFAINNKGYFGMGNTASQQIDFWEFDPVSNEWNRKADFKGNSRTGSIWFATATQGYVGMGRTNNSNGELVDLKDFWRFDP